jgi:WD40 repeat protein
VLSDGRVVSGSYDRTLRVWKPATGVCERVLEGHTNPVRCLSVLPDGRVISGSDDNTLLVWQPATGVYECVLEGHTDSVTCLSVLPDGRVVSGSYDKTLRVWQPATGVCERVLEGHTNAVTCLFVLSDGRVVSGFDYKTLRVWQPATGVCERMIRRGDPDFDSFLSLFLFSLSPDLISAGECSLICTGSWLTVRAAVGCSSLVARAYVDAEIVRCAAVTLSSGVLAVVICCKNCNVLVFHAVLETP